MQKGRDLSFDAFKGLAIIAVVGMHALYLDDSFGSPWSLCCFQLLNFAVPAFFFISGYWSSKESIKTFLDYKNFLRKRLSRILVPYLFWSAVLLGFSVIRTHSFDGYKIIGAFLTGGACIGYYFVILLMQFYIIAPVLQYINRRLNGYGLILVLVFNLAVLSILYLSRVFNIIWRVPQTLVFYSWIIYYQIGLYVGTRRDEAIAGPKVRLWVLLAAAFFWLISAAEAQIIFSKYNNLRFAIFPIKYSSLLYSVCIILLFLSTKDYLKRLPEVLHRIGYNSFGIYFIHIAVLGVLIKLYEGYIAINLFQPVYQVTLVAATMAICLMLIGIARRLLPESFCRNALGF